MRDQLINNTRDSETMSVRMMQVEKEKVGKNAETLTSLEGAECIELTNLHGNLAPLSTYSSEELHATTNHQLSKKNLTLKQMECGNQLLKNPNYISSRTDKNKLSPQQQSFELFSSSGTFHRVRPTYDGIVNTTSASETFTEKNYPQERITHVTIPYKELLQHQPENHDPMNVIIAGTEIFLQEGVAPSQLPAVSSLFSTRSYSSVSMSSVENKTAPVQQVVRVVKQFPTQSHTSDSRPALLRPKHRSVSMTNAEPSEATILIPKIRPRKRFAVKNNNHSEVVKPHSQSMFSDVPSNAPKGTSWNHGF
ncbi:unnamed protein product [Orchesella dallaii]|uniref:Uncharacterized protein n=1 Tax=Orchesella dallaii TaxID=48710 RepID=A0ABP1PYS7_9HEXA